MAEDNKELDEIIEEEIADEVEEVTEEEVVSDAELEKIESGIVPGLVDVDMGHEIRSSFLDYAMSVIVARALPDVRDGLKPVHRRIIFGMNELGMQPDKPHKKSARIVGDVMGKYHPHGDSAIYSTLVRLAQPFSIRYTLVDGHGNFGSIDGDEAAAMRYTEARMSKIALEMVRDINKDTVNFTDTYDGDGQEPVVLPAKFPNLLVNGSSGIAVGMATSIPPHNLTETINAVQGLIKNPDLTPYEIMVNYLPGPDFPTAGIILGRAGIKKSYETGSGSIMIRSRTHMEELTNGKHRIVVTEIPYMCNKAKLVERIGELIRDKFLDGVTDIRDESNKEGIRVVIECRKDAIPEVILNHLYKETKLQDTFSVNLLALDKGEPKIMNVKDILEKYLAHQCEVIFRRTTFDLKKAQDRLHILQGLLTAIDNIDEVIALIRASQTVDIAFNGLMERFELSDRQARAILDMKLQRLTGLEKEKIESERAILYASIVEYENILANHDVLLEVIDRELEDVKQRFGDDRRTEITDNVSDIEDEDLIEEEDVIFTLTRSGYIKRMSSDTFKTQNRGGHGVKGMTTNEDDIVDIVVHSHTHTDVLMFTDKGKVYRMRGYQIPESSRISKGLPIVNLIKIDKDEKVLSIISLDEYNENTFLFFATEQGTVKRTIASEFKLIRSDGKIAISLHEGDKLVNVKLTNGNALVSLASTKGKLVTFNEGDVRAMGRTAAGVKGMNVDGGKVVSITTSLEGSYILAISAHGYGKMSPLGEYRLTSRGSKGVITLKQTPKTGNLITTRAVNGDEDLLVITEAGIVIMTSLEQISTASRNTQGVIIIRLKGEEVVSSISIAPKSEDIVVEGEENIEQVDTEPNQTESVVSAEVVTKEDEE